MVAVEALHPVNVVVHRPALPTPETLRECVPDPIHPGPIRREMVIVKSQRVKNTVIAKEGQPQFQLVNGGAAEGRSAPAPHRPRTIATEISVVVRHQRLDQRPRPLPDAHKRIRHTYLPYLIFFAFGYRSGKRISSAFPLMISASTRSMCSCRTSASGFWQSSAGLYSR